MAAGILTPMEAFAGFGSDFIIMLAAIFVISGALQQTGVLDLVGSRLLLKIAQLRPAALLTRDVSGWNYVGVHEQYDRHGDLHRTGHGGCA